MDQDRTAEPLPKVEEGNSKEIRLTWQGLADRLMKEGEIKIETGETLIIHQIDLADFISLVEEEDASQKVKQITQILHRFSLDLSFEGSLALGAFQLADQSWHLTCGNTGFLRIIGKPSPLKKSIDEIVSFLCKIPVGQALVLKPGQPLFLEQVSADAMFNYYQHCQDETNPLLREKGQDEMFTKSCSLLQEKNRLLKIYGLNTKEVDRTIDGTAGGILFKPVGSEEYKEPRIVIGLTANP